MITDTVTITAEYVAGLGFDVAKEKAHKILDEKKLRTELMSYIKSQNKYNEMCSLAEQIDFQGLVEYIKVNLLRVANTRIFNPDPKKRGQARREIIDAAIAYCKADTDDAKHRVSKCISYCLDIIRGFYESHQLSVKDYLIADKIVDVVAENLEDSTAKTIAVVENARDQILTQLDSAGSLFSYNKAIALAEAGELDTIGTNIKRLFDHISHYHPYAPDFGYDYNNGMVVSKPLTEKAKKLFPPRIVLTGMVKINGEYYNDLNNDLLNYAYRHQLPITMEVSKAIKLLGEKTDPRQDETKGFVGNTVLVTPPEFPPAFPCSIKVGDKSFFEYVLLRTQEIEDDGTYVISNREQGGGLYIEARIKPNSSSKPDFKINLSNASNHELLNYVKFMNALSREKDFHIHVLSLNEDLIAGYIINMNYKTGFPSVEEEIDFIERVCIIEEHLGVSLNPCGDISNNDYRTTLLVSDLIRKEQIIGIWSEATFTCVLDKHFREELKKMDEELSMFSYVGRTHVNLFGAEFDFPFMKTFRSARIKDLEKVRQIAELLDDGDDIKFTLCAGEDNGTIETINIPKNFEEVSLK